MSREEKTKKARGAGADFLELARSKAEEFLKELSRSGESAQEALDDLAQGGRRSTDRLVDAIRSEVARQLGALGLVTKEDLVDLERRIEERFGVPSGDVAPVRASSVEGSEAAEVPAPGPAGRAAKVSGTRPAKATAARSPRPPRPGVGGSTAAAKKAPSTSRRPARKTED